MRKVLPEQSIGVLIRAALPRALRIAEINIDIGRQLHGNTICFELPRENVEACGIGDLPPEKALCIRTLSVNDDWLIVRPSPCPRGGNVTKKNQFKYLIF